MTSKTVEERFWEKVKKVDVGCWEWQASVFQKNGYGQFRWNYKQWRAHRVAWTLVFGEIPSDLCVLHRCDNPRCVRPDHLFLGTHKDNAEDRERKGRGCKERRFNAKVTPETVREIRRAWEDGQLFQWELAALHGLTQSEISHIVNNLVWREPVLIS
jgi:predicted XRE-type DNA-binding protein